MSEIGAANEAQGDRRATADGKGHGEVSRQGQTEWLTSSARLGGLLVLITLAVYVPAMRAGYIWDDWNYVPEDPRTLTGRLIRDDGGLRRIWFSSDTLDYWPLTHTMFWLEWRLWGPNPTGYHVVNVLLHTLAALLVWQVLKQLNVPGAWLAGLVFAVHPVCVASVAWISERKNTLSMVFYLLAILAYLRHDRLRSWQWYLLSLVAFGLGLLSKTSIVMLPAVFLLCAWWQRGRVSGKDLLRSVPFFILSAGMASVSIYCLKRYNLAEVISLGPEGFFARLAGSAWVVWFYLYKALLPVRLSMIYPKWSVEVGRVLTWLPMAALIAGFAILWRLRRTWGRPVLFAMGYFVVTLFPVLGFFDMWFMQHSLVADHFQYVPVVGVIALAAGLAAWICRCKGSDVRKIVWAGAAALVALLSVLSWSRAGIYDNDETLWQDTLRKNPNSPAGHYNLGVVYAEAGKLPKALDHYLSAIELRPNDARAHNNLAAVYSDMGELDKAVQHYTRATEIRPSYADAYYNLGNVRTKKGELDKAIGHYLKAVEIAPNHSGAHGNLGGVYLKKGQLSKALEHYLRAVKISPNDAGAHSNLGVIYAKMGQPDNALEHYHRAIRIEPDAAAAHYNLAALYVEKGELTKAAEHYQLTIRMMPSHPSPYNKLGIILEQQGRFDQALVCYRQAYELNPRDPTVAVKLAWLLATAPEKTLRNGRRAVQLAERACLVPGQEPTARLLDILAAAYAEEGRFREAVPTAEKALRELAGERPALAEEISKRLALYKASKPYHQQEKRHSPTKPGFQGRQSPTR